MELLFHWKNYLKEWRRAKRYLSAHIWFGAYG